MQTYPCPACGGVAEETTGCDSCGRAPDPVAAALARLNQNLANLEREAEQVAASQADLAVRRDQLQSQRAALTSELARNLATDTAALATAATDRSAASGDSTASDESTATDHSAAAEHGGIPLPRVPEPTPPHAEPARVPETSVRSVQNTLLALGGLLLGSTAVIFTAVAFTTAQTSGRVLILAATTALALAVPALLARRGLVATAETIAAVGLLLALLDGLAAYSADLVGLHALPARIFAALLFAMIAVIAAGYRVATRLAAPQFAALLATQPVVVLLAAQAGLGWAGYAGAAAAVALLDLAAASALRGPGQSGRPARLPLPSWPPEQRRWPRWLRETAWSLFCVALAGAGVLAVVGLAYAATVAEALRAGFALLCAAGVGVLGGEAAGRTLARQVATGAATLAVLGAFGRVGALAWPRYTLVLAAAIAAAIAVVASALPVELRAGPRRAANVAALLTGVAVSYGALGTAWATVGAASRPRIWHADLADYAAHARVTDWQVPAAALLLTVVAALAGPSRWRVDALTLGSTVLVLSAPSTGWLAWWCVPLLSLVAAAGVGLAALDSRDAHSVLLRGGAGLLLSAHAGASALARPGSTALVSALLAVTGVGIAVARSRQPRRFGAYSDPVVDVGGALAALTAPVATTTVAYLAGASQPALLAVAALGTALSLTAAAVTQLAAPTPRTVTAAGALLAAGGGVWLSARMPQANAVDLGFAGLQLITGLVITMARAFGSVPGPVARGGHGRRGATTLGSAAATAAVVCAFARVIDLASPGLDFVTATAIVLVAALAIRFFPPHWQEGPQLGASAVGGTIGLAAAGLAVTQAIVMVIAATPWTHADLTQWDQLLAPWTPFGWQVPVTLVLAAAAAWVLIPPPRGTDVFLAALALAGLSAPAALHLPWWHAVAAALGAATLAGLAAALVRPRGGGITPGPLDGGRQAHAWLAGWRIAAHRRATGRLALAAILGCYALAGAMARPSAAAATLCFLFAAAILVTAVARLRDGAPAQVAGVAAAAGLCTAPGAAAAIAITVGWSRPQILSVSMAVAGLGVPVLLALRVVGAEDQSWRRYPAIAVGLSALVVAATDLPDLIWLPVWAAIAAVISVAAAATLHPDRGSVASTLMVSAAVASVSAIAACAPVWLTVLVGPYRTLRGIWQGHAAIPAPPHAGPAAITLALLTLAATAAGLLLGGRRFILPAVVPPLATLALITPTALDAAPAVTPPVALVVALVVGSVATLAGPSAPAANRLLRITAGITCAVVGATGFTGSLATPGSTLAALLVTLTGSLIAALVGQDTMGRAVAWLVGSLAALATPVVAAAAVGAALRTSTLGVLVVGAALAGTGWLLSRLGRPGEANVLEGCAFLGGAAALLLSLGSAGTGSAVLLVLSALLGVAALRPDRSPDRRTWLIRTACTADLAACWLLLYATDVTLMEAYTLPFALLALLAGALELRHRPDLSSLVAYGPALVAGFLPSLVLAVAGDGGVFRQALLLVAGVLCAVGGSWRQRLAPVLIGGAVVIVMVANGLLVLWRHSVVPWYYLFGIAGLALVGLGATYERRLRDLQQLRGRLRRMS